MEKCRRSRVYFGFEAGRLKQHAGARVLPFHHGCAALKRLFAPLLASLLVSCAAAPPVTAPVSMATPSIAMTIRGGHMIAEENPYPRILMAAWPDGRIVWSVDQTKGGPPFRESKVTPAALRAILAKFEKAGVFREDGFRHSWLGPDSTYHSIWLSDAGKHTRIETWHELFEANPNLIVIDGAVTTLDGRKREDVIASDTKEFQEFRKLWSDLRADLKGLTPKLGKPVAEPLKLDLPR